MSEIDANSLANLDANTRKEILEWMESENSKSKVQMCMMKKVLNANFIFFVLMILTTTLFVV